ncbi:hypothetical protein [Segniliparus rugosus]|uniref:Uncharacterized protein n=1 Tax=Segniliparus rugosus (strain ATCC BAA-974 / DSM 45345 / CCUG 50838 / CIP 108380 / JCM 13579 / CDC 945) TaxID=679197 RepID=E5XME9_SEGRC|nr:hypothetical protein [Segniliparus rugosus]EFV14479.1 hypothetical protein HMPREF9336_00669 [Segniliparus rugosus ATCC BAA-974]
MTDTKPLAAAIRFAAILLTAGVTALGLMAWRPWASTTPPAAPTMMFVKTEDGLYTDKTCLVEASGRVVACSPLDHGYTVYRDGALPPGKGPEPQPTTPAPPAPKHY